MQDQRVDLDELVGVWHKAFLTAERALSAAGRDRDLSASELGARSRHLSDERAATVAALGSLAADSGARPLLVRLVSSTRETMRLLGLPPGTRACVFNVDGVLVASAALHADAWKETFDEFLSRRIERTGGVFSPFSRRVDYPALVHGRSREDAVREFLASRGISLPEGHSNDEPGAETVRGLGNRKSQALLRRLERDDVNPYFGTRLYLELARDAGLGVAVVSGSTHAVALLERARVADLVDDLVDGRVAQANNLARKPAPDMLLAACGRLGSEPSRTAVFETTPDGVLAARTGGFGFVVAVDHRGIGSELRAGGADVVVPDLGALVEDALAS